MPNERASIKITVNQFIAICGIVVTIVVSLFGAAAWVVNRLDRFEDKLSLEIQNLDARVDKVAVEVSFIRGQINRDQSGRGN